MSTAQPIALPSSSNEDIHMSSGSYSSFQAASFTRRYMDSPASWKASSFGSRFYPGMSPGQLLGPLEYVFLALVPLRALTASSPNEFEFGKLSSSIESDKGSIVNALNVFEREDELVSDARNIHISMLIILLQCRDYTCCGLHLTDLHALLEHFEECHVVVVDPYTQTSAPTQGASYYANPLTSMSYQGSFDPDDIKLDFDNTSTPSSSASSPPDTPVSTPQSAYPSVSYSSSPPSPRAAPISAFETTTVLPSRSGQSVCFPPGICAMNNVAPTHDVFNAYAGYSDYSSLMPGTAPSPSRPSASSSEDFGSADHRSYAPRSGCVTPALLLNSSANTPDSKPVSSRVASPAPALSMYPAQTTAPSATMASANTSTAAGQTPRASTMLSRPATSLLLSKPFRCLKPNCNKSYKQANGLKYHMTHGSCNFALPKDLEHLQVLLASKRSQKAEGGGEPISDAELREVEKEAERRLRPYACGVGDCQRRYKNMNGLRAYYLLHLIPLYLTYDTHRLPLPTFG